MTISAAVFVILALAIAIALGEIIVKILFWLLQFSLIVAMIGAVAVATVIIINKFF